VPIYDRYAYSGRRKDANPTAAAAQAAFEVLRSQYPGEEARLAAELSTWLDAAPDGPRKGRAIALGKATAAAILARREGDGYDFPGSYAFGTGPGRYQTTPPWDGFVVQPGFRKARPFALSSPDQHRPPSPPPLTGADYAAAYREVKSQGAVESHERTGEQTGYALFWMEFAEGSVNRLARRLVDERGSNLWEAARLLAHLNMALFDTYVAVWDSKYEYDHWRPYTAIRIAESDGNPATAPDAGWEPLRPTPPFPEYVSAHAAGCAATFTILARAFGDVRAFAFTTTTAPAEMPSRSFASFSAAARECADSRVQLGWHFRYATDRGLALGREVAHQALERTLRRTSRRGDDRGR